MKIWVRVLLALIGMAIIFFGVVTSEDPETQLALIIVGILLIQGGVWTFAQRVLGPRREYLELRNEVVDFLGLVRHLNDASIEKGAPEEASEAERRRILEEMHARIDRMAGAAGKKTR
jgi:hypothetical protein